MAKIRIRSYVRKLDAQENKAAWQGWSLPAIYAFKSAANLVAAQYAVAGVKTCEERDFLAAVDRTMRSFARTPWIMASLAPCEVRGDMPPRDRLENFS